MTASTATRDLFVPPKASSATIRPPAKHLFSVRGSIIDDATRREILYASTLERDCAYIMLVDRTIAHVADQPPAVIWIDERGIHRRHTLDFLATTVGGRRIGIAVKPQDRVRSSGIEDILERIRKGPSADRADEFMLRTDRHICRHRAADARLIIRARRTRVAEDVAAVADFVARMRGHLSMDAICSALPDVPAVFMRIVNLVDEGALRRVGTGRLAFSSHLAPVAGLPWKDTV